MNNLNELQIGIEKIDISPEKSIAGRLGLNHIIEPFDPIYAKAVAFKTNKILIVNISCEIVGLTRNIMNRIKKIILNNIDIKRENIILLGTHTHASPWVWDIQSDEAKRCGLNIMDEKWMNKVVNNTAKAGIGAIENLSKGTIYEGKGKTEGVTSNRVYPVTRWSVCKDENLRNADVGLVDDTVRVLVVKNREKSAIIANFACHPSAFGGGKTTKVSPDFPYYAQLKLKEKHEIDFMIYWQGCAGNSNNGKYNEKTDIENVRLIGEKFAMGIEQALDNLIKIEGDFEYKYEKHTIPVGDFVLPVEKAREIFIEHSKRLLEVIDNNKVPTDDAVFRWRSALKNLDISVLSNGKEIDIELQLIKISNKYLMFVPGEWYIENYFKICKENIDKDITITTLNTFDLLYIPNESNFDKINWYGVKTDMRVLGDEGIRLLIKKVLNILV